MVVVEDSVEVSVMDGFGRVLWVRGWTRCLVRAGVALRGRFTRRVMHRELSRRTSLRFPKNPEAVSASTFQAFTEL